MGVLVGLGRLWQGLTSVNSVFTGGLGFRVFAEGLVGS